jgi:hypothetical protein
MLYCVAENRQDCELGLRFLTVSLQQFCPNDRLVIYFPDPSESFQRFLQGFAHVELIPQFPVDGWSWNCKPQALLPLLERGEPEVVWLDSDLILTANPAPKLTSTDPRELIVAQEHTDRPDQGSELRTKAWHLPVGRSLPWTLNTCVLRVTSAHIPLLKCWQQLCNDPDYRQSATESFGSRPVHLAGDQDVLTALAGSTEFAEIPVKYLASGVDVVHSFGARGYTLDKRLAGLFRQPPTFIHGNGAKPWIVFHETHVSKLSFYNGSTTLIAELSPYTAMCRRYRAQIGVATPWLERRSIVGIMFRILGLGHHSLRGLLITLLATMMRKGALD